MRIPTYRVSSTPTGEAPGRSFRARMSATPFIQQAQAEGGIVKEFARQAGEFAATRYKAARETQINEKIIAGEEALREEARRLSQIETGKLRDVFNEGGKEEEGLWSQSSTLAREKLLEDVKDREARRILTDRFNQMELTHRFRLRGTIDQKIDQANQAARTARAQGTMTTAGMANDVKEFDLALNNFGVDSVRLGSLGLGNPDALKKQELAVVVGAVDMQVSRYINGSETPSKALEALRQALRDGDASLAGDGQMAFYALSKLDLNSQAAILKKYGGAADYIDAPTAEEQKQARIAGEYGKQAGALVTDYTSRIQEGQTLPTGSIEQLMEIAEMAYPSMGGVEQAELKEGIEDLQYIQGLATAVKGVANVKGVDDMIMMLEQGDQFGGPGIQPREQLGLEFLRGFKANMEKQLETDPIGFASTTGSVKIAPIDLSPQAVQSGQTGVAQRIQSAVAVRGHYELTGPMKLLTPAEVASYAPYLNRGSAIERMQAINTITEQFGEFAPAVLQQLAPDAPVAMHVAGLMRDGIGPEAEIIMNGIEEIAQNGNPIEGADMQSAEAEMYGILGAAYELLPGSLNAELKKNIKDTALAYYAEVLSRKVDKSYDSDLWEKAVNVATGYNPKTGKGGVQDVRGTPTLLPPNRSPDEIETALETITIDNFAEIATSSGTIDQETFDDITSDDNYNLQVLGRRNGKIVYGVVYGNYGESGYAIITDPDGNDINFTAEELIKASRRKAQPRVEKSEPVVQEAPKDQAFDPLNYDPETQSAQAHRWMVGVMSDDPKIQERTVDHFVNVFNENGFKYDSYVSVMNALREAKDQDAGFDLRDYDKSSSKDRNRATTEIMRIIENDFDIDTVTASEVRAYLRKEKIPHSNQMIETALNLAKERASE